MTTEPQGRPAGRVFLSAEWRDLVMLNYELDPGVLKEYVPRGTELDSFQGKTYVSLVGFRFLRTKLFGFLSIPFHANFDEVNLRFYVRRRDGETTKRGVVFIREIVPKRAIALLARAAYGENYTHRPMRHSVQMNGHGISAEYEWQAGCQWNRLHAEGFGEPVYPSEGSVEQFITEHYWGYAKQRGGGAVEYQVTHVPWRVWSARSAGFEGYASDIYGHAFAQILSRAPVSAFLADGSDVKVMRGSRIR